MKFVELERILDVILLFYRCIWVVLELRDDLEEISFEFKFLVSDSYIGILVLIFF